MPGPLDYNRGLKTTRLVPGGSLYRCQHTMMHVDEVNHLLSHLDLSGSGCIVETCAVVNSVSIVMSFIDRSDLSFVVNSYAINPLSPEYLISRVQDLSLTGRDFLLDATQPLSYEEIRAQHGVILAYPHPSLLDIILI